MSQFPVGSITWISTETERFYTEIIKLVQSSMGALNFNDILIALGCREVGIEWIVTFDTDFDSIAWIKRLSSPNDTKWLLAPSR